MTVRDERPTQDFREASGGQDRCDAEPGPLAPWSAARRHAPTARRAQSAVRGKLTRGATPWRTIAPIAVIMRGRERTRTHRCWRRPTGVGRALATYEIPIEGRDEWLAAARRLA
jgi:hypothetical protein